MGAHNIIEDIFFYIYGYMTREQQPNCDKQFTTKVAKSLARQSRNQKNL